MFDSIVQRTDLRPKRVRRLLGVSVGVHGLALSTILVVDQLRVAPVPEPSVAITFVDFSSSPPPPPPPPKKRSAHKKEPKADDVKTLPKETMAPASIPDQEPKPAENEDDSGSDDGVEGGVEGGIAGGVGMTPPGPVFQDMDFVKKQRIQGSDPKYPPQALAARIEGIVVAKITINVSGRVQDIEFLQSHPAFERAVRAAVEGWVFKPMIVNGTPVPFYTIYRFVFKGKR